MIGSGEIDGIRVLTLSSEAAGGIEAAFAPAAGMVCASVLHRDEQVLGQRNGLSGYLEQRSTMGIPLLHPWANRLRSARFELAGHAIDVAAAQPPPKLDGNGLPIHGLLSAARDWSVERHAATADGGSLRAGFDFNAASPLAPGFPFPHRLELEAKLAGASLTIETTVEAAYGSPVPIAFGFHPYLTLPGLARAQWRLRAPLTTKLVLDERGLPTGERVAVAAIDAALGESTYDDAYLAPAGGAPFVLAGGGRRLSLRFGAGYPFAQLYAPPGEQLIAIEPMTAPTNALITGGPSLTMLEPGRRYSAEFALTIEDE